MRFAFCFTEFTEERVSALWMPYAYRLELMRERLSSSRVLGAPVPVAFRSMRLL